MRISSRQVGMLALCAALAVETAAAAPRPAFSNAGTIRAADDGWDIVNWDEAHKRLLVAHGKDVLVIDPGQSAEVRSVGSIEHAHGVAAIPGTNALLVSSAHDNTVRILDETSGAEVAHIPVGADPDAAIVSAKGDKAYVMDSDGGAVSEIDLARHVETRRIALKPGLEFPVLVSPALLAVNNETASEIDLVDLLAGKAAGIIALPGCEGPTGMAYDPEAGLSLSACGNGKAALVDPKTRQMVSLLSIGLGPDTAIWDGAHHRFLVPCGKSGTLSIIRMDGRKAVEEPSIPTETSARTAALDPDTGRLYLPAARFGPAVPPAHHGPMVAGSFHILVMAPGS
ncbi:YncE family protein [Sphingomonas sp. CGMCC 1.13654]|uniref:YncE family protein n=1 Tax=Sphingomonas chungangi TaxID=2683589 RepID=A0A838L6B1_9SPHN|nr:YncE family protein [Sphingomonas chungangi]MBA2935023.1 YncE family protein [Sphingomonas chungangi]MVW54138.1 gluconolactonase [Sphingomonas chungangi]